jgi:integrase
MIETNPLDGLTKNKTASVDRYVTDEELALAVEVGRSMGGPYHICALALRTAWLCVRRSVEVRALTRDAMKETGILWQDGKQRATKKKPPVLIEWSSELKATIEEALAVKRDNVAGTMFVFGNMRGQRYTKGGWKSTLSKLMVQCEEAAKERKTAFTKFNLQDCRPKGVSDKLERGDLDTQNATGHASGDMITKVYDRRKIKKATPAA